MNRFTLPITGLALACGFALLTGCQPGGGSSEGYEPVPMPENICNDVTSGSYMQCSDYQIPLSPNDNWGSGG